MFEHFLVDLCILNSLKGENVCNRIPHTLEIPIHIFIPPLPIIVAPWNIHSVQQKD
jgi:hypothetical protein